MSEEVSLPAKTPSLFRNYLSFAGAAIVLASLASILLLVLIEITGTGDNPYLGIITYIILPGIMILGLLVIGVGLILERRRRRHAAPEDILAYPKLDLNDPHSRRSLLIFAVLCFAFISASAFGSYRAYEYTESVAFCGETCHTVMKPEHTAYLASPHARVRCVECHVGPGPGWYARSKLNGAYQLYSVAFNKYPRPITTPVHNLRPARDTCEHCHWSEKFFGERLKVFNRYAYDEKNTLRRTRMLINVGGGSPATGLVSGIHWHMNIANEVTYIASDEQRQVIPWIRVKDTAGNVTEYYDRNRPLAPDRIAEAPKRRMDCVDCHNRPAHIYEPPDTALDQAFVAGKLDPSLPYLKREGVALLAGSYNTNHEALQSIAAGLDNFYRNNYGEIHSQKGQAIKGAIGEIQRIYQTYFFPEMKTDWRTHPNNNGHFYSSGCFRCHDGEHVSNTGKVIRNDCTICHTVLDDSAAGVAAAAKTVAFQHPVELGSFSEYDCTFCHKDVGPFQHPVNLGDLSNFKCSECHPKEQNTVSRQ